MVKTIRPADLKRVVRIRIPSDEVIAFCEQCKKKDMDSIRESMKDWFGFSDATTRSYYYKWKTWANAGKKYQTKWSEIQGYFWESYEHKSRQELIKMVSDRFLITEGTAAHYYQRWKREYIEWKERLTD